tara:strand:+ start:288 stop:734 length:447 start_codon:yes stop_codon:yes gene_type:complete
MDNLKQRVEDIGVVYEQFGKTPIASRVFSFLLLSEPSHKTFDEIREFLKASKSAVSNAINSHLQDGTINYKTFSGDRKRYFYLDLENWKKRVEEYAKKLYDFNNVMEDVLKHRSNSDIEFNSKLKEVIDFQNFLNQKIDEGIRKWEEN